MCCVNVVTSCLKSKPRKVLSQVSRAFLLKHTLKYLGLDY